MKYLLSIALLSLFHPISRTDSFIKSSNSKVNTRIVKSIEIRSFNLKPGSGAAFNELVEKEGLPLSKKCKIDAVAWGSSKHAAYSYIADSVSAQKHSLKKLWVTDTVLAVPESVLFDAKSNMLYISLMNGSSSEKDGIGEIGKIRPDGKIINAKWISGLNAPKGMAKFGDTLYVADLKELVVIKFSEGRIIKKVVSEVAQVLNDVTVTENGIVFISDPRTGTIFQYKDGVLSVYLQNLKNPNGLKYLNRCLYFLANGTLYKCDKLKNITVIADGMDKNTDGLEPVKKGEYIVTCYTGVIYYVKETGDKQILLDTRSTEQYSADIGYNIKKRILYVPGLFNKSITAYRLK